MIPSGVQECLYSIGMPVQDIVEMTDYVFENINFKC